MITIGINAQDARWKKVLPEHEKLIEKFCQLVIKGIVRHGKAPIEISVVLTNDKEIQKLNQLYRGKNKPTNVLSFPLMEETGVPIRHLGDVVLSFETIEVEAKAQKKAFSDHVAHMIVHGLLHLLGYDHEVEDEAEEMERLEIKILADQGIANPYKTA